MTQSSIVDDADLAWGHAHPGPLLVLVQLVVYHHLRLCLLKLHVIVPDIGLQQRQLSEVAEPTSGCQPDLGQIQAGSPCACTLRCAAYALESERAPGREFSTCDEALLQKLASAAPGRPY